MRLIIYDENNRELEHYTIEQFSKDLASQLKSRKLFKTNKGKTLYIQKTIEMLLSGFKQYAKDLQTVKLLDNFTMGS